jgi:phospholipid/cholesterol/gamma-HCH transport system substrate-binding protein
MSVRPGVLRRGRRSQDGHGERATNSGRRRSRGRRHSPRVPPLWAGLIAIIVVLAVCYLVFGGSLPFGPRKFVLKAVFTSNTQIHIPSPVRIAGVDVGEVTSVRSLAPGSSAGVVTMQIDQDGLPIHADATAAIRERIFLEGNVYIDLQPGSPSSPILRSGATVPASNTSGPVQLNNVLSSLTSSARTNLQTVLRGLGAALNAPPSPAQDATQDPLVRGLTGGQALNESLRYSAAAFEASAIVNQALLGLQPHDLSGAVAGTERVFSALGSDPPALASLVTNFDTTVTALAARERELAQSLAILPPLLRSTLSADAALDAAFGPTQAFARAILPGVRELAPTVDAALPWLAQAIPLVSPAELGGLLTDLTPVIQDTSSAVGSTTQLLAALDQVARCATHNLIPTGDAVIKDPPASAGLQVYQELLQAAVGLAGASQNFDGNGRYLRASVAGGSDLVQTKSLPLNGPLFGNAVLSPLGTRPAFPSSAPPLNRNVACYLNPAPNVNSAGTGAGP